MELTHVEAKRVVCEPAPCRKVPARAGATHHVSAFSGHALAALDVALLLEHPTLDDLAPPGAPPILRRARALVRAARLLRAELRLYHAAVDASLAAPETDELPF